MLALLLAAVLSPAQVDQIIAKAEVALRGYVFPDVGSKAITMLKQNAEKYRSMSSPDQLSAAVNADLLAVTRDRHVRLMYPVDPNMLGSSTEDLAEQHQMETFSNYGFTTLRRLPGNIGYVSFIGFSADPQAGRAINAAMAFLADTSALIIDLRRNHGGDPRTASALEGYFFSDVQQITSIMTRDPKTGIVTETQQFTAPNEPSPLYLNKPVFLLTSSATFSCAEQFAYDLQALKRVTIVGEVTAGGANPGGFEALSDGFAMFIPTGYARNPITKTNWEDTGVTPDVATTADDALVRAFTLALTAVRPKSPNADISASIDRFLKDPAKALTLVP